MRLDFEKRTAHYFMNRYRRSATSGPQFEPLFLKV